jgi:hypothetical protein
MTDVAKTYDEHDKQVTKALQDILAQLDSPGTGAAGGSGGGIPA